MNNPASLDSDFLRFKLNRNELFGIFNDSVRKMLGDSSIPSDGRYRLTAYCSNVLGDVEEDISSRFDKEADYTFGCIGRLEKMFLVPMLESLVPLFTNGKKYNLVLIGGTMNPSAIDAIKNVIAKTPSVNLVITGYMYPIPISLLGKIDLFFSTAGSARVSYDARRPTIRVHHENGLPTGVFGSAEYPVGDGKGVSPIPDVTLIDLIQGILSGNLKIKYQDKDPDYNAKIDKEFSHHLELFFYDSLSFYNVNEIHHSGFRFYFSKILGTLGGAKAIESVQAVWRKLRYR